MFILPCFCSVRSHVSLSSLYWFSFALCSVLVLSRPHLGYKLITDCCKFLKLKNEKLAQQKKCFDSTNLILLHLLVDSQLQTLGLHFGFLQQSRQLGNLRLLQQIKLACWFWREERNLLEIWKYSQFPCWLLPVFPRRALSAAGISDLVSLTYFCTPQCRLSTVLHSS